MKKTIALLLTLVMLFALCACGAKQDPQGSETAAEWTREGAFEDADGNFLSISFSDTEGYEGWAVTFMHGEELHGWIIQQEGDKLHGNLVAEGEEGEFIVTISEEGEDGLLLEVEGGESYHFTPMDVPEFSITMQINTEGLGEIAYAPEGEALEFETEFPVQSAVQNLEGPATYVLAAKPEDGWKFVKWTKDGEDFSTEEQITVDVAESVEYIAVFESAE